MQHFRGDAPAKDQPPQCLGQPLRVVGADAAHVIRSDAQLHGIESRDIVEPEARRNADAPTVPPVISDDGDVVDLAKRESRYVQRPGPKNQRSSDVFTSTVRDENSVISGTMMMAIMIAGSHWPEIRETPMTRATIARQTTRISAPLWV